MRLCLILLAAAALPLSESTSQNARGRETAPTWRLVEDLQIGGEVDGPKSFSDIRGVVATRAGTIFVLDYKVQEIRVFDAKGGFLRRAARRGQGPGELANANGMAVGNDDIIWVNDPSNGRFSLYGPDGTFLRQILIPINGYGFLWGGVIDERGRAMDLPISIPTSRVDPATNRPGRDYRMRFVRPDGSADTVALPICSEEPKVPQVLRFQGAGGRGSMMMGIPFLPRQQIALTRKGTAWCTPSDEYRLSTGTVGSSLKEVVHLTIPPIPLPADERKRALDRVDSIVKNYGPLVAGDPGTIPRIMPMIANLFADDQGRAWVRRSDTPIATPSFDVFDPTGQVVATVRSPGRIGTQVFISGALMLTVIKNEDDVPMVVKYRIER